MAPQTNTTNSTQQNQKSYRIEEIPLDEMNLKDDEMLISVVHFYKDTYNTFGIPFLIKIKNDETWANVKERIQKKLNLSEKEWEKYKVAKIVLERVDYIQDDTEKVNVNFFKYTNKPNQRKYPIRDTFIQLFHYIFHQQLIPILDWNT